MEVATLDTGREERQETGRGQPGREGVMQGHTGSPTPSFSGGEGGWVGRGAPSSDMPFLPSLQQADLPPAMHHPLNTALRSQTAWGPGHVGSRGTLGGTYQGTGRCSQGQGLYNSGWHRSWLGNQGNLIRQGDQCQMLYLQFGGGGCITNSPPHSVS